MLQKKKINKMNYILTNQIDSYQFVMRDNNYIPVT